MKRFLPVILAILIIAIFSTSTYGLSYDDGKKDKRGKAKKHLKQKKDKKQDVRKKLRDEGRKRFQRLPDGRREQARGAFDRIKNALRERIGRAIAERLGKLDDGKIHWILKEHAKRHPECKFKTMAKRFRKGDTRDRFQQRAPHQFRDFMKKHPEARKKAMKKLQEKRGKQPQEMKKKFRSGRPGFKDQPDVKGRLQKMMPKDGEKKCPKCQKMQKQKDVKKFKKPQQKGKHHPKSIIV